MARGPPPWGHRYDPAKRTIVPIPSRAETVRWIFRSLDGVPGILRELRRREIRIPE